MNLKIFISYRRSDSEETTGRIYDRLVEEFGKEAVFRDIDTIPLKRKFADEIREWLQNASVVVVVIGPDWLNALDGNGKRRLDDPEDLVRLEIATALSLGLPIIPVMVRRAVFPRGEDLPESLRALREWNGQAVRPDPDFHADMERLIHQIQGDSPPGQSPQAPPRDIPSRPDEGMNDDQVKLLMALYVKEHRLSITEDAYEYRCVRTGPHGQYWGYEYTPYYIEITRDEPNPKRNPPGARIERLRWLGAFEEIDRRGFLQNVRKNVYKLSDAGKRVGYNLLGWMKENDADRIPKPGFFD